MQQNLYSTGEITDFVNYLILVFLLKRKYDPFKKNKLFKSI